MASEQAESSRGNKGKEKKANWTARQHAVWVEIVNALVLKGHRSGTTLDRAGSVEMMNEFTLRTGVEYTKVQFKNHWDGIKKDWVVWRTLVENTGLGWDSEKGTVVADDQWWTTWLADKNHAKYGKWRDRGLEFHDELDTIYGGTTATGNLARATDMADEVQPDPHDDDDINIVQDTQTQTIDLKDTFAGRRRYPEPPDSRRGRKRTRGFDYSEHRTGKGSEGMVHGGCRLVWSWVRA